MGWRPWRVGWGRVGWGGGPVRAGEGWGGGPGGVCGDGPGGAEGGGGKLGEKL